MAKARKSTVANKKLEQTKQMAILVVVFSVLKGWNLESKSTQKQIAGVGFTTAQINRARRILKGSCAKLSVNVLHGVVDDDWGPGPCYKPSELRKIAKLVSKFRYP